MKTHKIEDIFEAMDLEGAGCINVNEFVAGCLMQRQLNEKCLRLAFDRLD
ncbi:unnamed protein product, partial [Discosporangium mesarthrocarpum]